MTDDYDFEAVKRNMLQRSLYLGAQEAPDTEARLQRLAKRLDMPVDIIRGSEPEMTFKAKMQDFDYEKVLRDNPKLSSWLLDKDNLAVSHDDLENMGTLEKLFTHGRDYAGAAVGQGAVGTVGMFASGVGRMYGIASRATGNVLRGILPQSATDALSTPIPWWLSPEGILTRGGGEVKKAGEWMAPPKERRTFGTDVAAGVGQIAAQVSAYLLTGGAASTALLGAQGVDIMADKTATDKAPQWRKDTAQIFGGVATAVTERYGIDRLLNRLPPEVKNRTLRFLADKAAAFGIEAVQEFTEGLAHDLTRRALTNPEAPILEGIGREMTVAGTAAAIVRTALGIKGYTTARQNQQFFEALGDTTKASKLGQRMPEKLRELIEHYTKDGPLQQVFVPGDRFIQYFQEQGLDPAEQAQKLGVRNFEDAATGGDLAIPMPDFVANVAPSDHLQGLMEDLRLAPDELTMREAKEAEKNAEAEIEAMRREIEAIDATEGVPVAIERIIADAEGQLLGRYDRETARALATTLRSVAVLAHRATPEANPVEAAQALWKRYGLNIYTGRLPEVLTKRGDFDAQLDPFLDALRRGSGPTERQKFGPSLTEWLRERGGIIDEGGDLRAMDADVGLAPYVNRLARSSGMPQGQAREEAAGHGFIAEDSTPADFLDLIDRDIRGDRIYSPQLGNEAHQKRAQVLDELANYLDGFGVDYKAMSNAQIKELIASRAMQQPGELADWFRGQGIDAGAPNYLVERWAFDNEWTETRTGESGFPEWANEQITLDGSKNVTLTHDLSYLRRPGAELARYDIRDKQSGEVVGYTVLEIVGNEPARLTDIEINEGKKGHGYGERTLAALLASRNSDLGIVAIIDRARSWWERLGVRPTDSHDGLINFGDYADARHERMGGSLEGATRGVGQGVEFQQNERGSLQIGEGRQMRINLFETANLSTFIHEVGHFTLEVMGDLAELPNTSQQVKDDYARILEYVGAKDRASLTTEQHELWARATETYVMEGKSPAPELRGVFQRFASWLKLIYIELRALGAPLSDEIRGVFDRVYATDAEIQAAKEEAKLESLFADAKTAKMSEEEFAAYQKMVANETVEGKEALLAKLVRSEKIKRESWWKKERAKVAAEVAAEFDGTPAGIALDVMTAKGSVEKMSRSQLVTVYGTPILRRLPRGSYAENGADLAALAETIGFDSVDSMVQQLANLPPRARYIAAETERRMAERHGDLLNSVEIADEAMAAMHNSARDKAIRIELRALRRLARIAAPAVKVEREKGRQAVQDERQEARRRRREGLDLADAPEPAALRRIAAGMIGQRQVRDIAPAAFLAAQRKANKAALRAMAKQDFQAAAIEKHRELLNHYLFLEALAAKQESAKIHKKLSSFDSPKKLGELGKAGPQYRDQMIALLARFELAKVPKYRLAKRESLLAFLQAREAENDSVVIDQAIVDEARQVNWQTLTMDELRALHDTAANIAHLAGMKNKFIRKRKAEDFRELVSELVAAAQSSGLTAGSELGRASMKGASAADRGAKLWRWFDAKHLKTEQLLIHLDGGKQDGPWTRAVFDLAADAQSEEYDLHALVTEKLVALIESQPAEWRNGLFDDVGLVLPGFTMPFNRHQLISAALNMGNAGNIQRLADGYGWGQRELLAIRDKLTLEDMQFIQATWDAIEQLWPHMAALEERTAGIKPEKVEAVSFELFGKEWRGGYYPIVYDSKKSRAGQKQADQAQEVGAFLASGYGRAQTDRGATKKRLDEYANPLLLDFDHVLTSHTAKVIKDISHREAAWSIDKLLKADAIRNVLHETIGEDRYNELKSWLATLINDRADTLHQATGMGAGLMKLRTNTAIVTMGWKISTMMAQFAGIWPSLDLVDAKHFGRALIEYNVSRTATWAMIAEKSGEMRHRAHQLDRDVKDALRLMSGKTGLYHDVKRTAFFLTAWADRQVSAPTWLGAYRQALAEGKNEEDAVRAGDQAVRLSQGAGGAKDMASVQRNNELMKLITMYYTPFSVLYARLRDVGYNVEQKGAGYLPMAAARLLALVVLPAVIGDLLAGRGPDDDEDSVWWAIRKILLYPLATIPVIRDMAGYLEAGMIKITGEGEMRYAPTYKLSPVVGGIEKVLSIPGKLTRANAGDVPVDDALWDVFEATGYVAGMPTAQVRITGEWMLDTLAGDDTSLRDAIFRHRDQ